jgi:hypothetical protein
VSAPARRRARNWTAARATPQQSNMPAAPSRRTLWSAAALVLLIGCGGSSSAASKPTTPRKPAPAASPASSSAAPAPAPPVASPSAPATLPSLVQAGEIQRTKLLAVLSQGVGRFLQRVRVSGLRDAQRRFLGWQIDQLLDRDVIQPGDVLLRVNGQSVEHPEQLKSVWDSLVVSSELVFTIRRNEQQSDVRYLIVNDAAPSPTAAP